MSPASPIEVVLKFEQLINSHSADAMSGLLTEDSAFIDSLGNRVQGGQVAAGLGGLFQDGPGLCHLAFRDFLERRGRRSFRRRSAHVFPGRPHEERGLMENTGGLARCGPGRQDRSVAGVCRQRAYPRHHAQIPEIASDETEEDGGAIGFSA